MCSNGQLTSQIRVLCSRDYETLYRFASNDGPLFFFVISLLVRR